MPSLFDIGKSGLQAYRQSLAVTGQNIANINTDGYKKREASLEEVTGAGGGVTEISDQTGLGVRVENIKRAFDEFLLDKVRQTSSLFEKTDTFLQEVKDLENLLLPSDANLSNSIVLLVLKYLSKLLILILLFFPTNFFESKIKGNVYP